MGNYRVLWPCGFVNKNGEGETHNRPGAIVEVDDEQAKPLVASGNLEPVKESKSVAKPKPGS